MLSNGLYNVFLLLYTALNIAPISLSQTVDQLVISDTGVDITVSFQVLLHTHHSLIFQDTILCSRLVTVVPGFQY